MSLLRSIGLLVCRLYGDEIPNLTPVEKWSLKASKLCSADEIIAAAVIESFAKNYQDWALYVRDDYTPWRSDEVLPTGCDRYSVDHRLTNKNKSFKIYWKYRSDTKSDLNMFVNDVLVTKLVASFIQDSYYNLKKKHDATTAAAARAKADMLRNEAAWNLAERLLGMRRNEHGALVPVVSPESEGLRAPCDCDCDCDLGELCEICE